MSQPRSRLVGEVYAYCGEPPDLPLKQNGLPQELVFQILTENEDEMLRDLNDSGEARRISKEEVPLQFEQPEITLANSTARASYVQLRVDRSSPDAWVPVEIVRPSALLQASQDGVLAVAFHENMTSAELSWLPDSQQMLAIWTDRTGDDEKTKSGTTEIGNLYDSYLKLRTAAQCRELLGLDVGKVLANRLTRSEEQWQKHVNRGQQQGTGYKTRVFTPPRFRTGSPILDRTRFFVPRG